MSKINEIENNFNWAYILGLYIILALPILVLPTFFYPPDWGKVIIFRVIMAITIFLLSYQFLYKKNELELPKIKNNKIIWALSALFIIYLLASIFSVDPYFSFWGSPMRSGGFINFGFCIIFSAFIFLISKEKDWQKFWFFSIIIGALVSFVAIIQFYGLFNKIFLSVNDRPPSTIGNPIFLGIYILLLLFITISLFIKSTNKYQKTFYGFSTILFIYVILLTGSRAAYLGLIIGFVYFLLMYPKKLKSLKITLTVFLALIFIVVLYTNTQSHFPQILENNKIFKAIEPRLSIKSFLDDARFPAWMVGIKAISEKPILGWGPENYSVGFDKNFNYTVGAEWWDRAHNILIQTASDAGFLGLFSYLALFGLLLWELWRKKNNPNTSENSKITAHTISTTLIAYFAANFFSIDDFPTYLLFFLIVGYTIYLTNDNKKLEIKNTKNKYRELIIWPLFIFLLIFLWQYNIVPFFINEKINRASNLVNQEKCDQALSLMDDTLNQHSLLDGHVRLKYVEFMKTCTSYQSNKNLEYTKKGIELLTEAAKIQPLYARTWLYLGSFQTVILANETDQNKKAEELKTAYMYFNKAGELAPNHQDIFIERAKTDMIVKDYISMDKEADDCIRFNPNIGDCYFEKALTQIYLGKPEASDGYIKIAKEKNLIANPTSLLNNLVLAFSTTKDYIRLAKVYEELSSENPNFPDYHSSLAFTYKNIGEYEKAREQALIFLKLVPDAKDEVDAFLKTLPY
jgi:putative inorganic carbon (HCO3(-)) transporter